MCQIILPDPVWSLADKNNNEKICTMRKKLNQVNWPWTSWPPTNWPPTSWPPTSWSPTSWPPTSWPPTNWPPTLELGLVGGQLGRLQRSAVVNPQKFEPLRQGSAALLANGGHIQPQQDQACRHKLWNEFNPKYEAIFSRNISGNYNKEKRVSPNFKGNFDYRSADVTCGFPKIERSGRIYSIAAVRILGGLRGRGPDDIPWQAVGCRTLLYEYA